MSKLYSSPLRVYLMLGFLALLGIYAGLNLPVSLYPNSTKPVVWVSIPYGNMTSEEFLNTHGKRLEGQIRSLTVDQAEVERIEAWYNSDRANYDINFKWGAVPNTALKEVQTLVNGYVARLSDESRDGTKIYLNNENSGFFAVSFYSETRDLDDLYDYLEPLLGPKISRVKDAQDPTLWNPSSKEIRVQFNPGTMAALGLFPRDVEQAVHASLGGRSGGSITVGTSQMNVEMPRQIVKVEDLRHVPITAPSGRLVHLGDIAHIGLGPKTLDSRSFKTNGAPSLILFATPRAGGNVKRMSEELLQVVKEIEPTLPKDIQYRVLVDPSEFIRSAVQNVFHEVGIAAMLAVLILFLFIGSVRNVITAAIEIPMSMILAFLLMRWTGMNLNLISLGGLALSAGMNVDASVVVMENIFRHFEMEPGPHDAESRLRLVIKAVREVMFPIIASTIASLVVFLPLTLTSDLSYAILGDLAYAVVFSHGFSAVVALLLVPTVRLHLMKGGTDVGHAHSPIETQLKWLETFYGRTLGKFLMASKARLLSYGGLAALLVALIVFVIPRLPKEIVSVPDTDWMVLSINTEGNTLVKQMETQAEEVEKQLLDEFGGKIRYTFSQVWKPNSAMLMARLKNKGEMRDVWKAMEKRFTNTPLLRFWVGPWNPSELPIPNPPDMLLAVRGGSLTDRASVAKDLNDLMEEKKVFPRIETEPNANMTFSVVMTPHNEQWTSLRESGAKFSPSDLADLVRVATQGRMAGYLPLKDRQTEILFQYPPNYATTVEEIAALPLGANSKVIPLKALARVEKKESMPAIFREDQREVFFVKGRIPSNEPKKDTAPLLKRAQTLVAEWEKKRPPVAAGTVAPTVAFEEASKDLSEAIHQLTVALALSILLIFLTMMFQFGSVAEPLLVLVSVPLGFIGVLVSLFVFGSTLSLNSILGVILLNGISVANSIILVDFIKRLVDSGMAPKEAAIEAAQKRLRPILITSMTTVLGMLPVAIGLGEGGRILQPLGIAVSGGLWVSMGLTLFLVPALQVGYLEWRSRERSGQGWVRLLTWRRVSGRVPAVLVAALLLAGAAPAAVEEVAPLSFETALQTIVERHPDVGIEKANLGSLEGKNLSSHLSLLPSVSLFARQRNDNQFGATTVKKGVGFSADLNLFRFGGDVASMRAASAEEAAQEATVGNTLLKAELDGAKALTTAIQAELEWEVQKKIVAMWDDYLKIARQRYQQGRLAHQEADKVEIDLENARAQMRDTEASLVTAKAQLTAYLGDQKVEMTWPWRKRLEALATQGVDEKRADLSRRPDWASAEKKTAAVGHRESQALGNALPSLDANFTYGYFDNRLGGVTSQGPEWSGGVSLTIPLFDRLAKFGEYRSLAHQRSAAELAWEKVKRFARADWESAVGALKVSLQTAQAREGTVTLARKLYEDNLKRFRQGLAAANEVSVDQQRLFRAEILAISGWSAAHLNLVRFCHSRGDRVAVCLAAK